MTMRGGRRPGAGRPKGAKDKLTREAGATLGELARTHTETALNTLVEIATKGKSEAARISAASALLDRGHGKATVSVSHSSAVGVAVLKPGDIEAADKIIAKYASRLLEHAAS